MGYMLPSQKVEDTSSDLELERLNIGILGKIFGTGDNASSNIAGFAVMIAGFAILIGIFMAVTSSIFNVTNSSEIWSYMSPIITIALGYLFGRGS